MENGGFDIITKIIRYGIPVVVGLYYINAYFFFDFTPDSTFLAQQYFTGIASPAQWTSPEPAWMFLSHFGTTLGLDKLLVMKVLSLLCSCCVILFSFLLGLEIIGDRFVALCVSFSLAVQGWLLQLGPSGSALPFALALMLVSLFFLFRNEYLLASVFSGVASLVFWQAGLLVGIIAIDVFINSRDARRAGKVAISMLLVLFGMVVPWLLYAWSTNSGLVPSLVEFGAWPERGFLFFLFVVLTAVTALGSLFPLEKSREEILKFIPLLLWVGLFLVFGAASQTVDLYYLTLPAVTILGFNGMRRFLEQSGRQRSVMVFSLLLTTLIVLVNQIQFFGSGQTFIRKTISQNRELEEIGVWLKVHLTNESVSADRNGIVGYFAQTRVDQGQERPTTHFVVTDQRNLRGYKEIFSSADAAEIATGASHFALWECLQTPVSGPPEKKGHQ